MKFNSFVTEIPRMEWIGSMEWILYNRDPRNQRVNEVFHKG